MKRRTLLVMGAAAAASRAALAQAPESAQGGTGFGAPVVELYVPAALLSAEQKSALIKGFTEVIDKAMKVPRGPARRLFVTIIETAQGGFGVDGQVFAPRR